MARYLVTGAAGFIGSKVAEQLLDRGDEVVGIDNLNDAYDIRLKHWRLRQLEGRAGFSLVRGDIADPGSVGPLFQSGKFDAVLNLAARAGVRQSVEIPQAYIDANVTGTLNLLRMCVEHKVPKFVLSSTSSLYGGDNPRPYVETLDTDHTLSPYAASKKAAEVLCYTYHYLFKLDITVFRYFTVYGPAGRPDMMPFRFVQWVSEGKTVFVYGDGTQERDFTFIDDVAAGTIAGLKPVGYETINLGSDEPIVLADALATIEECVGKKAVTAHRPRHPADVHATWADITKAEKILGWRPQTSFRDGVRKLVEWYQAEREWASQIETGS